MTTVTNQLTAAAIATGVWQDSTAGDFTAASSIGKSLGGAFTALGTSVYSTASLVNAPTGGSAPTVAQIATGVWQDTTAGDFTVASSIGKSLFTSGAVPGASGGLFIAGSNAATTVNFTGNLSGSVGSVTGAVGSVTGNVGGNVVGSAASVTGSVGSISGVTFPTNFSSLLINGSGYVTITSDIKQGVSATIVFTMTDSTTHAPKTGIGSSFTRNEIYKGGGAGAGTTNTPSEVGDGWYSVVLTASETNTTSIALTFEASGADQLNMLLIPQA